VTRPLRIGIQLPEVERPVRWGEIADIARVAEDIGLDSIWTGDHLLYRDETRNGGPWEAWSILAGLATVTGRVAIGPLVAATSFHAPAMLAKKAATVDEMSGGRLVLGLGAGWNEVEYRAYGFPFDQRVSRFEEAFTIIRTLLAEGHVDFEGRFYQARDCELLPRGPRPGGPPLLIGSNGERMLSIALPHVAAWNSWYRDFGNSLEGAVPLLAQFDAACAAAGRDPVTLEKTLALKVAVEGAIGARDGDGCAPYPAAKDPGETAEFLRRFADAGVAEVQLVLDPISAAGVEQLAPTLEVLDR
jgi:alkanesulfonate monooxygenase SsuD/methylene tetrahydromethanopterin reductase-like flavin-dependent oxidoreductase (luciferase family)